LVSARASLRDGNGSHSPTTLPVVEDPPPTPLTPRQMEIARLISLGRTNQQIADALVLTPGTVANHVQHILDRLGVHSRTQVAVWYSRRGVGTLKPHDAARLEFEPRQTAGRNDLTRDTQDTAT